MSAEPPSSFSGGGKGSECRSGGRRSRLSLARKLLFGVIVCVVFFALLEIVLLAVGVTPVVEEDDPFVGFSEQVTLFTEGKAASGSPVLVTAENRLELFNRQSFLREKSAETCRIFCVGGSTTYGRPYDDKTSFAGWLRAFLPEADPNRNWEVVNAGGISYASFRIAILMRELTNYEPDLFVIYTGHNEFLEDRTYASLINTPESVRSVGGILSRSRTFTLMKRLIDGASVPQTQSEHTLPADVDAMLDRSVGPSAYHRDEEWRQQVVVRFRSALERVVDLASSVDAQVILVSPACNLRDCSPFKSEHRDGLTIEELRRFRTHVDAAKKALGSGNHGEALGELDRAIQIDQHHAAAHFLRGRVLLKAGDAAAARDAFLRAREEDICPLRAVEEIQKIVRTVAEERNVPLIDFASIVAGKSEHEIPGADWFLDHVHPTITGHQLLARELLQELVRMGVASPRPTWTPDVLRQVAQRVEEQIDPADHAMALRNLAKVLSWAGKVEEADRLALRAVESLQDDAETHTMAGFASLRLERVAEAKAHFEKALRIKADDVRALDGLGDVYSRRGQHEAARDCFARAAAIDPKHAPAHFNLGNAWRNLGRLDRAAAAYRTALSLAPDQPDTHKNLALTFLGQRRIDEAVTELETALRLDQDNPVRYCDLGFVLFDAGRLKRAKARFEAALKLNPRSATALAGLGLIQKQNGHIQEAIQTLRQAVAASPDDAKARYTLAGFYLEAGQRAAARRELQEVLRIAPRHEAAKSDLESLDRRQ